MEILTIENLEKDFGDVSVIKGISLHVHEGEFISMLGPSGCGKTTMLRIIAGLESATSGTICIQGKNMADVPVHKRPNGMVFQSYALFPHMTTFQNISFGLEMKKIPKSERKQRVAEVVHLTHLEGLEKRYPREMSGGQQQRVALARAIVTNPVLLLMDEALSNLDAKLRKEMQTEIRTLQKKLKITTIFVTHDQEEALTMSDQIAVMNSGIIEQFGTPYELYESPHTQFVANFIGTANLIHGTVLQHLSGGFSIVQIGSDKVSIKNDLPSEIGQSVCFFLRPERILLRREVSHERTNIQDCMINSRIYLGNATKFCVTLNNGIHVTVLRPVDSSASELQVGDHAYIMWNSEYGMRILTSPEKESH